MYNEAEKRNQSLEISQLKRDNIVVAGTGHRPDRLGGYKADMAPLKTRIKLELLRMGAEYVISGAALGFDSELAQAALELDIPLILAIPMEGHGSQWPEQARQRLEGLMARATQVVFLAPVPSSNIEAGRFLMQRNIWMLDLCTLVIACYDGSGKGGTAATVHYAGKLNLPVSNLGVEAVKPLVPCLVTLEVKARQVILSCKGQSKSLEVNWAGEDSELVALLRGLEQLKNPCNVQIISEKPLLELLQGFKDLKVSPHQKLVKKLWQFAQVHRFSSW